MTTPIPQDVVDAAMKVSTYVADKEGGLVSWSTIRDFYNECDAQRHIRIKQKQLDDIAKKLFYYLYDTDTEDCHENMHENIREAEYKTNLKQACRDLLEALGD